MGVGAAGEPLPGPGARHPGVGDQDVAHSGGDDGLEGEQALADLPREPLDGPGPGDALDVGEVVVAQQHVGPHARGAHLPQPAGHEGERAQRPLARRAPVVAQVAAEDDAFGAQTRDEL